MKQYVITVPSYRKKYNITQEELAKAIGMTYKSLSNKENYKNDFKRSEMIKITEFFKQYDDTITISDLFFN